MIRIALCDDNPVQLNITEDLIRAYFTEHVRDYDIMTFLSGERLLAAVDSGYSADIYFLDIIMPGIKGIALGKDLRSRGDNGRIIYLTATAEYAVDSYNVGAFFYILKPVSRQKISEVLDSAITAITRENVTRMRSSFVDKHVTLKVKEGRNSVLLGSIAYIDIINRALAYHLTDGSVLLSAMLRVPFAEATKEFLSEPAFLLASSGLIVNLSCIGKADGSSVTFINHETIFPARSACAAILEKIR